MPIDTSLFTLRLHAMPVSQPSRAVMWAMAIADIPHEFTFVDVMKGEASSDAYYAKFPAGGVPALEVLDKASGNPMMRITEAGAILTFIAETFPEKVGSLFPVGGGLKEAITRARINQWLHWSHSGVRFATTDVFRPILVSFMTTGKPHSFSEAETTSINAKWKDAMLTLTYGCFRHSDGTPNKDNTFLVGHHVTIADLAVYCELDQIVYAKDQYDFESQWPEVWQWLLRMRTVTQHDEVRTLLFKIFGDFGLLKK